jgi:hypothetical protein
MADEDVAAETGLDKVHKAVMIVNIVVGLGVTLWFLWDMEKDNPLGWPAQLRRWWEHRAWQARLARREYMDLANFGLDLGLYLEREVERWKSTST